MCKLNRQRMTFIHVSKWEFTENCDCRKWVGRFNRGRGRKRHYGKWVTLRKVEGRVGEQLGDGLASCRCLLSWGLLLSAMRVSLPWWEGKGILFLPRKGWDLWQPSSPAFRWKESLFSRVCSSAWCLSTVVRSGPCPWWLELDIDVGAIRMNWQVGREWSLPEPTVFWVEVTWYIWRRKWQPIPVFLPGKSHWQGSLVCYRPWGCKESDVTERLNDNKVLVAAARDP